MLKPLLPEIQQTKTTNIAIVESTFSQGVHLQIVRFRVVFLEFHTQLLWVQLVW